MRRVAHSLPVVFLVIAALAFSQDTQVRKVLTTSPVEGGLQLDVDGKTFGPYASLEGTPWFSRDGRHWGMVVRRPDSAFVILVDGQEKAVYPKEYDRCWDVSVSPGAAPVVIVNGQEYPGQALRYVNTADEESFTWFSTDGQGGGTVSTLKVR